MIVVTEGSMYAPVARLHDVLARRLKMPDILLLLCHPGRRLNHSGAALTPATVAAAAALGGGAQLSSRTSTLSPVLPQERKPVRVLQ